MSRKNRGGCSCGTLIIILLLTLILLTLCCGGCGPVVLVAI